MPSSVLYPRCPWRDLAMCCSVLRSLWRRCPCGLTVIVIVLLTRFCTCSAMGPLCHKYMAANKVLTNCYEMQDTERLPARCKNNQVCCKNFRDQYYDGSLFTSSACTDPTECKEFPGPSYCNEDITPNTEFLDCRRSCQDDECGMSFQFPGTGKLHFYLMIFTGAASLGPLSDKKDKDGGSVWHGVESIVQESPEENGCAVGVNNEPADQKRKRYVVQFMVHTDDKNSKFLDDLKANWNKRLMAPKRRKFTNMIDFQLPVSLVPYDFTLPCPEVEDEHQGIRTRWPYSFAVGLDIRVLCSQEGGFNPQKFALRTCQKDGKWSDDVDVYRCLHGGPPQKDRLNATQVNNLPGGIPLGPNAPPPQGANPGEDGDAEEARPEDDGESSGLGLVPALLIGAGVGLAIVAIVVGLTYWKLKGSSSSQNVSVESQQPPDQQEDIASQDESGTESEAESQQESASEYSEY